MPLASHLSVQGKLCNYSKYGGSTKLGLGVQEKPHKFIIWIVAVFKTLGTWCGKKCERKPQVCSDMVQSKRCTSYSSSNNPTTLRAEYESHQPKPPLPQMVSLSRGGIFKSWECTTLFPRCARWMDDHNMICSQAIWGVESMKLMPGTELMQCF